MRPSWFFFADLELLMFNYRMGPEIFKAIHEAHGVCKWLEKKGKNDTITTRQLPYNWYCDDNKTGCLELTQWRGSTTLCKVLLRPQIYRSFDDIWVILAFWSLSYNTCCTYFAMKIWSPTLPNNKNQQYPCLPHISVPSPTERKEAT